MNAHGTTLAVVLEKPEQLVLSRLALTDAGEADVVVDIEWTGISTGTERLLWAGRMPPFPGLGYPLVPGYESVGRIVEVGARSGRQIGERVFVPGAKCYGEIRGLFGGAAAKVVVPGSRVTTIGENLREEGVLLALAATAYHALAANASQLSRTDRRSWRTRAIDRPAGDGARGSSSGRLGTQSRPGGGRRTAIPSSPLSPTPAATIERSAM